MGSRREELAIAIATMSSVSEAAELPRSFLACALAVTGATSALGCVMAVRSHEDAEWHRETPAIWGEFGLKGQEKAARLEWLRTADLPHTGVADANDGLICAFDQGNGRHILWLFGGASQPMAEDAHVTLQALLSVAILKATLLDAVRVSGMLDIDRELRHALDAGQLGTWRWSSETDMVHLDVRAASFFGVSANQPMPRSALRERVLPDDRAQVPPDLRSVLERGEKYLAEYRVRVGDGVRWLTVSGLATRRESDGAVDGLSGTVQDISERKMQEAALRQSEKLAATGRLAATIAHEINNPLEAVTNLIYLAKTDPLTPGPVQRLLETADSELSRVAQIAQGTLGFYRDTTRPMEIDVADLLASIVDLFGRKLDNKKLACKLDLADDLRIFGLHGEIRQVFSNLLVNAIEASEANSHIRIRGKSMSRGGVWGVSIVLSDLGAGIPSHIRPQLFTPFVTTKQSTGTGLGLWVSRGIVEKQGGSIGFRSCSDVPPTGTVFRVFLPSQMTDMDAFHVPHSPFVQ